MSLCTDSTCIYCRRRWVRVTNRHDGIHDALWTALTRIPGSLEPRVTTPLGPGFQRCADIKVAAAIGCFCLDMPRPACAIDGGARERWMELGGKVGRGVLGRQGVVVDHLPCAAADTLPHYVTTLFDV